MIEKMLEKIEELRNVDICTGITCAECEKICGKGDCAKNYQFLTISKVKEIVQEVAKDGGWIPVEQKTPEDFTYVYVTCISLIDNRKPWVTEGIYNSETGWRGMSPMLDFGKAKVVAWMPKKTPAPYQKGE